MERAEFADILGDVYMRMELSSHWKGQFFSPYHLCEIMAMMSITDNNAILEAVKDKGYVTINDPACGAGGMLIAGAQVLGRMGINYQKDALFIAQDIDPVCALMTYIQMSLLGMPGIVQIGNTITLKYTDTWYTPFFMMHRWKYTGFLIKKNNVDDTSVLTEEITPAPAIILPQPILDEVTGQYSLF
jgi:type I restriction-modification system DNA methylase subunit